MVGSRNVVFSKNTGNNDSFFRIKETREGNGVRYNPGTIGQLLAFEGFEVLYYLKLICDSRSTKSPRTK
jgi:hypothetical protein